MLRYRLLRGLDQIHSILCFLGSRNVLTAREGDWSAYGVRDIW
jgi:hypothetical protein